MEPTEPTELSGLPHVLVVGAGFAGMSALEELRSLPVDVTLLDRNLFHTFQPLLYQVATAGLNPGDVAYPARATVRQMPRTRFHLGELVGVNWEDRKAVLADGQHLAYDYLILAIGAGTNFFGIPGAEEHSLAIYTIPQAVHVRDRVFARLEERAACEPCTEPLRIVVVGGGPTGVEMAGTLAELRDALVGFGYPELSRSDVRVVLVEMLDRTLGAFDDRLSRYAAAELERRGVELRLGQSVAEVREDEVLLSSGELLGCAVTIWAAGVRAPRLADDLGLDQVRGQDRGRAGSAPDGASRDFRRGGPLGRRHGGEPRPPTRTTGHPGGASRGSADRTAARAAAHRALRLPRQGHHGHDRASRRRPAAARRPASDGNPGLAGLARAAHLHPRGPP